MRKIAILGSTGSIGTQALEVIKMHPDQFKVTALSAHSNASLLFEQVRTFKPKMACLSGAPLQDIPSDLHFCTFTDAKGLETMAADSGCDDVLVSVVGAQGLALTLSARKMGKRILLANKETLVAGGELVMKVCQEENGMPTLLPVDSEHSAIFQCLRGADHNKIHKLILTASGGPFRTWTKERIKNATLQEALNHPTWSMGRKITIDSASMFNKALEIIEAKWLFDVEPEQIDVAVHPQSIVHSMVSFEDGALLAQLGQPDMKVPILYAMSYPKRLQTGTKHLDFSEVSTLTFENGDKTRFPALALAYEALKQGGATCCILNAANEVAVEAFLKQAISFGTIAETVEHTLQKIGYLPIHTIDDVYAADLCAREIARAYVAKYSI